MTKGPWRRREHGECWSSILFILVTTPQPRTRVSVAAARADDIAAATAAGAAMAHLLRDWVQGDEHLLVMPYGIHASVRRAVRLL
jgi:hypothetical protein